MAKARAKPASKTKEKPAKDVYDVERIVDKRNSPSGEEYYVKWRGFPSTANTWEPAKHIYCDDLIKTFEDQHNKKVAGSAGKDAKPERRPVRGEPKKDNKVEKALEKVDKKENKADTKREKVIKKTVKEPKVKQPAAKRAVPRSRAATRKKAAESDEVEPEEDVEEDNQDEDAASHEMNGVEEHQDEENPAIDAGSDDVDVVAEDNDEVASAHEEPRISNARKKLFDQSPAEADQEGTNDTIDFTKIKQLRVINESHSHISITLQGIYSDKPIIVKLEKTQFNEAVTKKAICDKDIVANRDFLNDVYSRYNVKPPIAASDLSELKATVVWPATDKAIEKYSKSEMIFFTENPDTYSRVVKPFIQARLEERDYNQWVYNILKGELEKDRVILDDDDPYSGFVLVMDLNWDGDEKTPNVLAISHRDDIKSLRDLNDEHLTLLKNIMTKGTKTVKSKFKKMKGQLRTYIHYQPSFYHFHVHFKAVDPGDYLSTDRDNLLSTVINNISVNKDYYKKSTLSYPLATNSALYKELKKSKKV